MDKVSSEISTLGKKTSQEINAAKTELKADISDVKKTVVAGTQRVVDELQEGLRKVEGQIKRFETAFNTEISNVQAQQARALRVSRISITGPSCSGHADVTICCVAPPVEVGYSQSREAGSCCMRALPSTSEGGDM